MAPPNGKQALAQQVADSLNNFVSLKAQADEFWSAVGAKQYDADEIIKWVNVWVRDRLTTAGVGPMAMEDALKVVLQLFALEEGEEPRRTVDDLVADETLQTRFKQYYPERTLNAVTTFILDANDDAERFPLEALPERQYTALIVALAQQGFISPEVRDSLRAQALGHKGKDVFDHRTDRIVTVAEQQEYIRPLKQDFERFQTLISAFDGEFTEAAGSFFTAQLTELYRAGGPREGELIIKPLSETLLDVEIAQRSAERQAEPAQTAFKDSKAAVIAALQAAGLPYSVDQLDTPEEEEALKKFIADEIALLNESRKALSLTGHLSPEEIGFNLLAQVERDVERNGRRVLAAGAESALEESQIQAFTESISDLTGVTTTYIQMIARDVLGIELTPEDAQKISDSLKKEYEKATPDQGPVPDLRNAVSDLITDEMEDRARAISETAEDRARKAEFTRRASDEGIREFLFDSGLANEESSQEFIEFLQQQAIQALSTAPPNEDPFVSLGRLFSRTIPGFAGADVRRLPGQRLPTATEDVSPFTEEAFKAFQRPRTGPSATRRGEIKEPGQMVYDFLRERGFIDRKSGRPFIEDLIQRGFQALAEQPLGVPGQVLNQLFGVRPGDPRFTEEAFKSRTGLFPPADIDAEARQAQAKGFLRGPDTAGALPPFIVPRPEIPVELQSTEILQGFRGLLGEPATTPEGIQEQQQRFNFLVSRGPELVSEFQEAELARRRELPGFQGTFENIQDIVEGQERTPAQERRESLRSVELPESPKFIPGVLSPLRSIESGIETNIERPVERQIAPPSTTTFLQGLDTQGRAAIARTIALGEREQRPFTFGDFLGGRREELQSEFSLLRGPQIETKKEEEMRPTRRGRTTFFRRNR